MPPGRAETTGVAHSRRSIRAPFDPASRIADARQPHWLPSAQQRAPEDAGRKETLNLRAGRERSTARRVFDRVGKTAQRKSRGPRQPPPNAGPAREARRAVQRAVIALHRDARSRCGGDRLMGISVAERSVTAAAVGIRCVNRTRRGWVAGRFAGTCRHIGPLGVPVQIVAATRLRPSTRRRDRQPGRSQHRQAVSSQTAEHENAPGRMGKPGKGKLTIHAKRSLCGCQR